MLEITPLTSKESIHLKQVFYHSLFRPPGQEPFPPSIVEEPHLAKYHKNWGRAGDCGMALVELSENELTGAAWVRFYDAQDPGYGFVAESIPEMTIAIQPAFRGQGWGTRLLRALIAEAKAIGHPGISLSVDRRNPAIRLYQRLGFKTVNDQENPTMLLSF